MFFYDLIYTVNVLFLSFLFDPYKWLLLVQPNLMFIYVMLYNKNS